MLHIVGHGAIGSSGRANLDSAIQWEQGEHESRLVMFDLDGTLMPGTSTTLYLAEKLGHGDRVAHLERDYRTGKIDNTTVAIETGALFEGVSLTDIEALFRKAPRIANIKETVARLRQQDCVVVLGSITWSFFVSLFAREYGFDDYCGTSMECRNGKLTGRVVDICTEHDKLSFFLAWRDQLGIPHDHTIAIGDSRSDHPVFEQAGLAIALNADAATRQLAAIAAVHETEPLPP